jgi:hypothetical protein
MFKEIHGVDRICSTTLMKLVLTSTSWDQDASWIYSKLAFLMMLLLEFEMIKWRFYCEWLKWMFSHIFIQKWTRQSYPKAFKIFKLLKTCVGENFMRD